MRTSSIVTISLPIAMIRKTAQIAKKQSMTRSELFRQAIREYVEVQDMKHAEDVFEKELAAGTLKELTPGMLSRLM